MSELARIISYYPDYAVPEWHGALFIDRQWFESFLRNCADDNVALTAMCWFTGTRDLLDHKGAFEEWKSVPAATWGEYKLAANEIARHQLDKLPAQGAVFFEFATPATWWRVQQEGRKWDSKLDRSHQVAYYEDKRIRLESRVAQPAPGGSFLGTPATTRPASWFTILRLVIMVPWLIYWISHSCSSSSTP